MTFPDLPLTVTRRNIDYTTTLLTFGTCLLFGIGLLILTREPLLSTGCATGLAAAMGLTTRALS